MRRPWLLITIAATSLLLGGCVRYYKTSDVRSRLARSRHQLDRSIAKVEADFRSKRASCRDRPAGDGHRPLLARMTRALGQLRGHRAALVQIEREFARLARGRRRIRSDSAQWEPLQQLRERTETLGEQVQGAGEAYKEATNQLAALLRGGR